MRGKKLLSINHFMVHMVDFGNTVEVGGIAQPITLKSNGHAQFILIPTFITLISSAFAIRAIVTSTEIPLCVLLGYNRRY
jgi:hypothetical protein